MFIHRLTPHIPLSRSSQSKTSLPVCELWYDTIEPVNLQKIPKNSIIHAVGMGPCTALVIKAKGDYFAYHRPTYGEILLPEDKEVLGVHDPKSTIALFTGINPYKDEGVRDFDLQAQLDNFTDLRRIANEGLDGYLVLNGLGDLKRNIDTTNDLIVNTCNGLFAVLREGGDLRSRILESVGSFDREIPKDDDLKYLIEDAVTLTKFVKN